jgi:hypothetical protein
MLNFCCRVKPCADLAFANYGYCVPSSLLDGIWNFLGFMFWNCANAFCILVNIKSSKYLLKFMSFCSEQNKGIGNCLVAFQTLQLSFGYFDQMNCLRLWMLSEIILLFWGATTIYFDHMNLISFTYPCSVQSPLIFNLVVYILMRSVQCAKVNYSCTMHNIFLPLN